MPAILGLRDTSSYASDRPENWRRMILLLFPNGKAPLTALLALTEPEETNDPHFWWYEKGLPLQRTTITASYLAAATTVNIANLVFRVGHLIMNELTGEVMEVTGVDSTGLVLTVLRGKWSVAAAASSGASDPLVIIGNVNAEGGFVPQSISTNPNPIGNITEIFRTPLEISRTAMGTSLQYDRTGPYKEELREKLSVHSIEMEKAFIFGLKAEYNDPATGKLKRTTGGILSFLPAGYKVTPASGAGAVTMAEWNGWLELLFRYGSDEKLALMGSGVVAALNNAALNLGTMETVPGGESFGMALNRWITPFGTLYFRTHPLFTQHPVWRFNALITDMRDLKYRHMIGADTTRLTNRQANDQDARIDEFLTEAGLEVHHAGTGTTQAAAADGTHMYITNVQSWSGT